MVVEAMTKTTLAKAIDQLEQKVMARGAVAADPRRGHEGASPFR